MASLQSRLGSLITAIGADIKSLKAGDINRPLLTTLPSSSTDGKEYYYLADATKGIVWHVRYNASSSSNYKWECVGEQRPLSHTLNEGGTIRTTGGANTIRNWSDLTANAAGDGPRVVIPSNIVGEFRLEYGYVSGWNNTNGAYAFMSVMLGPDDPGMNLGADMDFRRIETINPSGGQPQAGATVFETQLNNGDQVYCRYATSGTGLASFRYQRYLKVYPLRIRPSVILV